ncbi:hypothetical protein QUB13_07180 [Microcoleus sp. B4-D4]
MLVVSAVPPIERPMSSGRRNRQKIIKNILSVGYGCYKSEVVGYGSRSLSIAQIADRP